MLMKVKTVHPTQVKNTLLNSSKHSRRYQQYMRQIPFTGSCNLCTNFPLPLNSHLKTTACGKITHYLINIQNHHHRMKTKNNTR